MTLSFFNTGVKFDGRELPKRASNADMVELFGYPVSSRSIPMHPRGERIANVSASGVVWYVDYPENDVSHLHVAIYASKTPENPPADFQGAIYVEGHEINRDMTESAFSRRFPEAVPNIGHCWVFLTSTHSIHFGFAKTKNELGKRTGTRRLESISVSFLRP